ncbi:MAG: hypothetical protein FWH05_02765 [Oscillospiraceae bacterium]|nr:hypothetical protein [Oscillospiraceae bacterium]
MGMPIIRPGNGSRDQAITDVIESIALQETALSHILNAEGEKMQAFIAAKDIQPNDLLRLNCAVAKFVRTITKLEFLLDAKLELALNFTGEGAC